MKFDVDSQSHPFKLVPGATVTLQGIRRIFPLSLQGPKQATGTPFTTAPPLGLSYG